MIFDLLALTMVYEKANSIISRTVEAPDWIHKYIVGKRGANIRNITINYPKASGVFILFLVINLVNMIYLTVLVIL